MNEKAVHDLRDTLLEKGIHNDLMNIIFYPATGEYKLVIKEDFFSLCFNLGNIFKKGDDGEYDSRLFSVKTSLIQIE